MARNTRYVGNYDTAKDLIEKDVGDKWGRVPHLVANDFDEHLVLYFPNPKGFWNTYLASSVDAALKMIDELKG